MNNKKYKLLARDFESGEVTELTRGTFEHCNDYMVNDYEQNLLKHIELGYSIDEIL